jgi:AhpD family alkylhydroperoxidase
MISPHRSRFENGPARAVGGVGRCADRPLRQAPGTRRARRPPEAAAFSHARWCRHARGLTLADALSAREAVQALADPGAVPGAEALQTLSAHYGLDDVAALLGTWIAERDQEPDCVDPCPSQTACPPESNGPNARFGHPHEREGTRMTHSVYPPANAQIAQRRKQLAPDIHDAFHEFSRQVFAAGALDEKTKQLIAVAVAHVTQCPYCIRGHTKAAVRRGASEPELMEAIWVAAEMRAGGAYAHSTLALDAAEHANGPQAT